MTDPGVDDAKRTTLRRFAALGALPLAASRGSGAEESTEDPLPREAIRGYIASTPGAHFSKLRDDLELGTGAAQHHLRQLVEADEIETVRDGDYRRYYPAGQFSDYEQTALGYLRRPTARGMLLVLLRDPDRSGVDIASDLDVSRATISDWAGRLAEAGLLTRSNGYHVTRPETLMVLVIRYADSLGPDAVAFADSADEQLSFDP